MPIRALLLIPLLLTACSAGAPVTKMPFDGKPPVMLKLNQRILLEGIITRYPGGEYVIDSATEEGRREHNCVVLRGDSTAWGLDAMRTWLADKSGTEVTVTGTITEAWPEFRFPQGQHQWKGCLAAIDVDDVRLL